ncbi:MAG: sigma-70 family RNA polymerase sigma factor [Phycisphaeraceae bacterium]|nr:sigma-70 family RNA polymerase sigma factor [Phycisphaeraceae bacterium]MCW5762821.1 sigma-70 family RNA polymerase sigma factor [Phycisphaeraceae bacterium]
MLTQVTTSFIARLRANDEGAWFELWEVFGPIIRAQLTKWGKGRIGAETVRDLSQETLAALSSSIDRYDPGRGARFSTWLLAIAKHVLGDEMDRRMALKRGGGKTAALLDETWMSACDGRSVDRAYEEGVFRSKVEAAIRMAEREADFTDFSIYRMRVLDGQSGKDVASALGISEPTVSRRLAKIRDLLRIKLTEVMLTYSFTEEEREEAARNGLSLNPKAGSDKNDDSMFDDAIAEIYHRQLELRRHDEQELLG